MWQKALNIVKVRTKERISRTYCAFSRRRDVEDEGDWCYSSEWWDQTNSNGQVVYRAASRHGNGVVSVKSYPSSSPRKEHWRETERWLASRQEGNKRFRVLGYEWRTLRFNDKTRQSTVKVMTARMDSQPRSLCLMQSPHCLAVPYLKSMVSLGLATIAACNYNLIHSAIGKQTMRILCIGHGGGSLPLFLACKIPGAIIDIVEIDPVVISASITAMGFPSYSVVPPEKRAIEGSDSVSKIVWRGIHERIFLYECDAERFILNTSNLYDIVFIDAYDGEDIFPFKLWDPDAPFLQTLKNKLHPHHGTVVVNLHSDDHDGHDDDDDDDDDGHDGIGNYINRVSRSYRDVITCGRGQDFGAAFSVSVPWICNTALSVCRGKIVFNDSIMHTIASKGLEVERILNFPFPCWQYIANGFKVVDSI